MERRKALGYVSGVLAIGLAVGSFAFASEGAQIAELNFDGVSTVGNYRNVVNTGASLKYDMEKGSIAPGLRKKFEVHDGKLYIVEFNGPITEDQKAELAKLNVTIGDYIPDFAYVVEAEADSAQQVAELDFIKGVKPFLAIYKIDPKLLDKGLSSIAKAKVQLFKGANNFENKHMAVEKSVAEILDLALSSDVIYVGEAEEFTMFNSVAKTIIKQDVLTNNTGYTGVGQIVGIADTGLDSGYNDSTMHLDFQGRIKSIYALGRRNDASDPHGHGTHVAGSVLGDGARSNGEHAGMAPGATLVFQSVLDRRGGLGGLPANLNDLYAQAWADGARIHTNSWGASVNGAYTTSAQQTDEYAWNNDMTILFAASNDGPNLDTLGSPGTAKNVITVGASENYRPEVNHSYADDPNHIAAFSSRGYTDDGRVKPDIMAPGTWILSARSSLAADSSFWANYDSYYAYMGGTSMATPVTAGAVAVLRESYIKDRGITPMPSLLKASLIASATDMGMGFPSPDQGWGRINIDKATRASFVNETTALATGQKATYTFDATAGAPLKMSLVWTDYPGSTTATKQLVNDLDLVVTAPDGTKYYGNDFSSPYNDSIDGVNNVENVFINAPQSGTYTIEVNAYNVPQGPQAFSIAIINE